jgi:hypothetical protein
MNNRLAITLVFCIGMAGTVFPFTEIFLIGDKTIREYSLPDQLAIGIVLSDPAYFKLTENRETIMNGMLNAGLNQLNLISGDRLKKAGIYRYHLFLKKDRVIENMRIELVVTFQQESQGIIKEPITHFVLSMYIKNQLMGIRSKSIIHQVRQEIKKIISSKDTGPLDPLTGRYPNLDRINLLNLVPGLFKSTVKKLPEVSRENGKKEQRPHQLSYTFFQEGPKGGKRLVKAKARLKINKKHP